MTLEMAVAPIALAMANHPDLERYDLSSLRYIMWGATPVTPSVAEAVTARTGVRWLPAYGTSEVPVITANPVDRPEAWRLDSAGLPVGDVELRVADLDTGAILAAGETGEVQVRSATAMAGYLPDEATTAAFADGEWYRTGDVGYLEPEGWVHLTDRAQGDDQGERVPGRSRRNRGRPARTPRRRRLRRVRCTRRAVRRSAGRRRPVGARRHGRRSRTCSAWWATAWPRTSTSAAWSWSRASRGRRRARSFAASCATSGPRSSPPR